MAIKKRRRVRLNSSPAGRAGRHSLTPVKGKKKVAVPGKFTPIPKKPSMGVGGVYVKPKPKPKVSRKPGTRKVVTRRRRA
jgi:hypothetical protein